MWSRWGLGPTYNVWSPLSICCPTVWLHRSNTYNTEEETESMRNNVTIKINKSDCTAHYLHDYAALAYLLKSEM